MNVPVLYIQVKIAGNIQLW